MRVFSVSTRRGRHLAKIIVVLSHLGSLVPGSLADCFSAHKQCQRCRVIGARMYMYNRDGLCRERCIVFGCWLQSPQLRCGSCPLPTATPSDPPSMSPAPSRSLIPSWMPTASTIPSSSPSSIPTSMVPSMSLSPSMMPFEQPTLSLSPSITPSMEPSLEPTVTPFDIFINLTRVDAVYQAAFHQAEHTWESVIRGDIINQLVTNNVQSSVTCALKLGTIIDDLYVCAVVRLMDGVGQVLGTSGPRYVRNVNGKWLTATGSMTLDGADLAALLTQGILNKIILHEMGHVLGLGSLWIRNGLATAAPNCTYPANSNASQEYRALSNCPANVAIPLPQGQSDGTACGHWDETCLGTELMTGYATGNLELSRITIAGLADLGYQVNYDRAEPYTAVNPSCRCNNTPPITTTATVMTSGSVSSTVMNQDYQNHNNIYMRPKTDRRRRRRLQRHHRVQTDGTPEQQQQPQQQQPSESSRQEAVAYGKRYLNEMKQLHDSLAVPERADSELVFVGHEVVSILYMDQGTVFSVLVMNSEATS